MSFTASDIEAMRGYVFEPMYPGGADPPGAKFVVTKPGIPDSDCQAESLFECELMGDELHNKRYFRMVDGAEFIETVPETDAEAKDRIRKSLLDFTAPTPTAEVTAVAAAVEEEAKNLTPATVPAGLRNGSNDKHDSESFQSYIRVGPLSEFVQSTAIKGNNSKRITTAIAARSALNGLHHLMSRAVQRGEFDRDILFSPGFQRCFTTEYDLLTMNPDVLVGMVIALDMFLPKNRADAARLLPHPGLDPEKKGSAREVALCAKLLQHMKKASIAAKATVPVVVAAAAASSSSASYTTTPVITTVTETTQRPAPAPAPAAAAAAAAVPPRSLG